MLRDVETREFGEEGLEARFFIRPVDVWAETHQKAREFGQRRHVALDEQRDAVQHAVGVDVEGEIFLQHVAALEELARDERCHFCPVEWRS